MERVYRGFRRVVTFAVGAYCIGMVVYLALRVLFGDGLWWLAAVNTFAHFLFLPLVALVPLALLTGKRNLLRLLPFALIAGVWLVPYYLPKNVVAASAGELRVATFNIWGANQNFEEIETWIRESGADVVMLQELPERYSAGGIPRVADVYPYQQVQSLETRVWGNAILSRLPLAEMTDFDLEDDGTPSHQRATITWNGKTVALYNIHLVMPVGGESRVGGELNNWILDFFLRYNNNLRDREIHNLLAILEDEPHPFIMGGDFNMSDQSVIYQQFAGTMGDSFREAGRGFGATWPTRDMPKFIRIFAPFIRIDYIWHSPHFRAVDAYQTPPLGSDHLGLVTGLEMIVNSSG